MSASGPTPDQMQEEWNKLRDNAQRYNQELSAILNSLQRMMRGLDENYNPIESTYVDQVTEILEQNKVPSTAELKSVELHFKELTANINSIAKTIETREWAIALTQDEIDLLSQANDHAKQLSALRKSSPDYKSRSTKIAELGDSINQQVSGALTSVGAFFVDVVSKVKDSVKSYAMTHGSSSSSYSAGEWEGTEYWYTSPNAKQDNDSIFSGFGKLLTKAGSFFSSIKQSLSSSNPDRDALYDPRYDDVDLYKDRSTGFDYSAEVVDDPEDPMPPQTFNEAEAKKQQVPQNEQPQPPQVDSEVQAAPQDEVQDFSLPISEFKKELNSLRNLIEETLTAKNKPLDSETHLALEDFKLQLEFSRHALEKGTKTPTEVAQTVNFDLKKLKELEGSLKISPELKQKIDDVQRAVDIGLGNKRVTFAPNTKG